MTVPYIQCMFVYNTGSGDIEFTPTYPAIGKQPLDGWLATRHDSITSSGIKQAVLERIDDVMTLTFSYVPQSDLAAWKAMMQWLLAGNVFAYRPNAADNTVWGEYTLDSMDWTPKWIAPQTYSFELKCRMWVGGTVVSGS
jgi:hypothetical protein